MDEGARLRLLALRDAAPALPRLSVFVVAPPGRAPAVNDTLESLRAQWFAPDSIKIITADAITIPGQSIVTTPPEPGAATRLLCAELNEAAAQADYVAVLNAGDTIAPDACLRFALAAAGDDADLIYCDEIVPREGGAWVRQKPAWDVTRLRQSAYLGDWVWYGAKTLRRLGGFDESRAGAEEYDYQLRLAETDCKILRLPEALFTRSPQSRRDNIPAADFCARAADAITAHLTRAGIPATVQNRQHPGLFHHLRLAPDPGTSFIMLCDGADIAALDQWMTALLTGNVLTGPVILTGAALDEPMTNYLTAVTQQTAALEGKVLAVPPAPGLQPGQALAQALAMVTTPHVAILDIRAQPATQHWAEALRARLTDPGITMVAARALVPLATDKKQFSMQGPIIIGADTRLGAGHMADDPGPGGWLVVDQEASAVAPPALLARSAALAACTMPSLAGDALWIDLCAQLRAQGGRIAWTPDVSFITPPEAICPDTDHAFRQGGAGCARAALGRPIPPPGFVLARRSAGHRAAFRPGARRPSRSRQPAGERPAGRRRRSPERRAGAAPHRGAGSRLGTGTAWRRRSRATRALCLGAHQPAWRRRPVQPRLHRTVLRGSRPRGQTGHRRCAARFRHLAGTGQTNPQPRSRRPVRRPVAALPLNANLERPEIRHRTRHQAARAVDRRGHRPTLAYRPDQRDTGDSRLDRGGAARLPPIPAPSRASSRKPRSRAGPRHWPSWRRKSWSARRIGTPMPTITKP